MSPRATEPAVRGRAGRVHAYWLEPRAPGLPELASLEAELEASQRRLLAVRRRPEARRALLVGRALLRRAVARWLGAPAQEVQLEGGGRGPLRLAGTSGSALRLSLSHTPGLVACAVADVGVGIDVESLGRAVAALRLARRFFSPAEAEELGVAPPAARRAHFLALWTAKEAALKACGLGLAAGLDSVAIEGSPASSPRAARIRGRRLALRAILVAGHRVALAAEGESAVLSIDPGLALFAPGPQALPAGGEGG